MKKKRLLALAAAALIVVLSAAGCIEEEDEVKKKVPLTWEMVARYIDYQLGEISDGTPQTCNGQGDALGAGAHCKDRLQGRVTQSTLVQYVEFWQDESILLNGDTMFYERGFMPQTTKPCEESLDGDSIADYSQVCASGSLACAELDDGYIRLTYSACQWQEPGGSLWTLDGTIDLYYYTTTSMEQLLVIRSKGLTGTNNVTNGYYTWQGDAVKYVVLNPWTGGASLGSTGTAADGMEIINAQLTVDLDGAGGPNASATYVLFLAQDYEDGLVFLSGGRGDAVWLSNPTATPLRFYAAGLPWDNTGTGCLASVQNIDTTARTFDIVSQGTYGQNGCVPDATGVAY